MAKSGKAHMTPKMLKWAREKRVGLSIDYAAKKLKVKPERLGGVGTRDRSADVHTVKADGRSLSNQYICSLFAGTAYRF